MQYKVSVIIPLYNTEKYIDQAIQSILQQNYKITQIIVVDDGSTDSGAEIVKKYPEIELIQQENKGLKRTLNIGLEFATGEIIGFLDADDRWTPNKVEVQLNILHKNPSIDLVFARSKRFKMVALGDGTEREEFIDVVKGKSLTNGLYKKQVFDKIGNFNEVHHTHTFIEWFDRAIFHNLNVMDLEDVLYERRIHDSNMGIIYKERQREQYLATIKASLDRRRNQEKK
jgi:glycosyltransferase involved in cell wall biosynthesis